MNRYPLWKYLLILALLVVSTIYALPNLYGEDPALQVSGKRQPVDAALMQRVQQALGQTQIGYRSISLGKEQVLVRFDNTEDQLRAADVVQASLGSDYVAALNLAPKTPDWLRSLGAKPMFLGLDLRGGVHFLMEVDMDAAMKQADERYEGELRSLMRNEKLRYLAVDRDALGIHVKLRDAADRSRAIEVIRNAYGQSLLLREEDVPDAMLLHVSLAPQELESIRTSAIQQNIITLRNRVNELGVAEPIIQQQGKERIVVQLPGVQDTARAKDILGATATLEFRLVAEDRDAVEAERTGRVPAGTRLYHERSGAPILLQRRVMLTGDYITDASSGIEQDTGSSAVFVTLDGKGARLFSNATKDNVGRLMAVVFIESKSVTRMVDGKPVKTKQQVEEVINVARIRDQLGKRFQITGLDNPNEARDLALLLRAGALAAPLEIVEERTVGPSLGAQNIAKGFNSTLIGFAAIALFMAVYYRFFGLLSTFALGVNLLLLVSILSLMQATLTLPGIAGIALTLGMSIDANVLIIERIREEMRLGNSPQAAIHAGYDRAFDTILDSNITTLIAGVALFWLGSGPVRGFAVVLCIGILTSMFSAVMVSRGMVNLIYGRKARLQSLSI